MFDDEVERLAEEYGDRNHGRVFKALMSAHLPGWRSVLDGNCQSR